MRPGQESRTAVMVCAGRALAHGRTEVSRFSDPTALALLPPESRARVERMREGILSTGGLRERLRSLHIEALSRTMVGRTVAVDDAVRSAASPQVVILGAGLDGRAWRMDALREVTVFEVDHPDSQRQKRARAAALEPRAKEIRFVPVDFARDDLDAALETAGHDPTLPTTWIWEGVVMYLTLADIEATLRIVSRRSPTGSRLIVAYHGPALALRVVGAVVRRVGEPLRSAFTADQMRALLAAHGFDVLRDEDLPTIAAGISRSLARRTRGAGHLRIATADRHG